MKLNRIKRRNGNSLVLELTPLIDVVFLLLIFFLVATSFQDVKSGIKIDLPQSSIREMSDVNNIQVVVTKSKEYFITYREKGKTHRIKTSKRDLEKELREKLEKSQSKDVIISADKNLNHGTVVDVMTISKEAGAQTLDIDTSSEK
ncbi:MAG: biopolymer transporter ExbD [Cetobacterium sp.]|uniref:Biopolymer transport protein ExbD n=1 Tax=Cetobacterium ceti TaxID=180163 RepID=A0A1T4K015_9FUSO|nr:biopolymer transporter ExbD [Cetobacterium ceti]MCJ8342192.1 biopolymer transporter ExbD [Cetobacterium sp.]SJZ35753.1 biopolymer transport protein ExbD [Cetobacterium ceti]